MPLPAGLQPSGGHELVPVDEPIVHRTFMAEVGPRAVLVGYPDNLHVAFDANAVRLAKAWKGRFYDAAGMWEGRGGKQLPPLGTDVLDLPAGPSFATLAALPTRVAAAGQEGPRRRRAVPGYLLDKLKQPIFCYETHGVTVQEKDFPSCEPPARSSSASSSSTRRTSRPHRTCTSSPQPARRSSRARKPASGSLTTRSS